MFKFTASRASDRQFLLGLFQDPEFKSAAFEFALPNNFVLGAFDPDQFTQFGRFFFGFVPFGKPGASEFQFRGVALFEGDEFAGKPIFKRFVPCSDFGFLNFLREFFGQDEFAFNGGERTAFAR